MKTIFAVVLLTLCGCTHGHPNYTFYPNGPAEAAHRDPETVQIFLARPSTPARTLGVLTGYYQAPWFAVLDDAVPSIKAKTAECGGDAAFVTPQYTSMRQDLIMIQAEVLRMGE